LSEEEILFDFSHGSVNKYFFLFYFFSPGKFTPVLHISTYIPLFEKRKEMKDVVPRLPSSTVLTHYIAAVDITEKRFWRRFFRFHFTADDFVCPCEREEPKIKEEFPPLEERKTQGYSISLMVFYGT
jgi:hypothetical protein